MLLAEELALVALRPDKGRPAHGTRDSLNACLAGLLLAELALEGMAEPGEHDKITLTGKGTATGTLAAVADVVGEKGPKIKSIVSGMDRGLSRRLGMGTWDAVTSGLVDAGVLTRGGGRRPSLDLIDARPRDEAIVLLRAAAGGEGPIEPRTALVLSMAGPADLLEIVAPERGGARRHARQRIDHALDGTQWEPIGSIVRRLIADAEAAAAVAATVATVATGA